MQLDILMFKYNKKWGKRLVKKIWVGSINCFPRVKRKKQMRKHDKQKWNGGDILHIDITWSILSSRTLLNIFNVSLHSLAKLTVIISGGVLFFYFKCPFLTFRCYDDLFKIFLCSYFMKKHNFMYLGKAV